MKIVIASGTFFPEVSGQASYIFNLLKYLGGNEVKVISYSGQSSQRVYITLVKRNLFRFLNYALKLYFLAKKSDLIYAQDLFSSGLPATIIKKVTRKKLAIRLGGDFLWEKMVNAKRTAVPLREYYNQPKSLMEKLYLIIYKFILNSCDLIIFNTAWQQDLYLRVFKLPAAKTFVIDNPIDIPGMAGRDFSGVAAADSDNIIYAGRLIPLKNLDRLIRAYKKVKTDKNLLLVGSGSWQKELEELAKPDRRIKFLGSLEQSKLHDLIAGSYLVVLPSLSEISPNLALECLFLEKPILLTKEVGFNKDLKDLFTLVDPLSEDDIAAKIQSLLNAENYNNYLNQLKSSNISYSWAAVAEKHLKAFERLL